jgi:hypothetical protein
MADQGGAVRTDIGDAEFRHIRALEAVIRDGRPMTPVEFARRQGLSGTSSFKRYPTLKRILNLYGWLSAPEKMRGPFPSLIDEFAGEALAANEDLRARLAAQIEAHAAERSTLQARIEDLEAQNDRLKGLLSYTIAHFVGNDMERGTEIEAKIRHWARQLGADPEQQQIVSHAIDRLFASVGIRGILDDHGEA